MSSNDDTQSKNDDIHSNTNDNNNNSNKQKSTTSSVLWQRKIQSITLRCNKMYDAKKQHKKKLHQKLDTNNKGDNDNSNTNCNTNNNSNSNESNSNENVNQIIKKQAEIGYQGTKCDGRLHICVIEIYSDEKCTTESAVGRIAVIDDHMPHAHNHDIFWENRYTASLPSHIRKKGIEYYNKLNLDQKHWLHLMSDYCFNEVRDDVEKETGWRPSNDVCIKQIKCVKLIACNVCNCVWNVFNRM